MSNPCLNCSKDHDEHRHPDSACPLPRAYRGFHAGYSDVLTFASTKYVLGEDGFNAFLAALERAPRKLTRLSELMQSPSPFGWDDAE
jgi:hypothetical protein